MAHANVLNSEYVDDDGIPVRDLPFADRMTSKFANQIQYLASQRSDVPSGWHRIFDDAIISLRAVDCPKRNGIEFSEIAFSSGALKLATDYATTDKVVPGILSRLCKRSSCTCQECGRGYGAVFRHSTRETLCASCHVHADLAVELRRWLDIKIAAGARRSRPILEVATLPINMQLLIQQDQIKTLRLVSGGKEIYYVTPADVEAHVKTLAVMKGYLDQLSPT